VGNRKQNGDYKHIRTLYVESVTTSMNIHLNQLNFLPMNDVMPPWSYIM